MADLTRFDFHAKKFYFSEHVQSMSAEEVGQYLLLMVAAWLGGKDASLPDNPVLLARYARVQNVSELVLKMFPIVETEHGPRRRNETLFEEWSAAIKRSEEGRASVLRRADRQPQGTQPAATSVLVPTNKVPTRDLPTHSSPSPSHAGSGPGQTGPVQSSPNPTQGGQAAEAGNMRALPAPALPGADPTTTPDFKTFRITWRAVVGKPLGHNKTVEDAYVKACKEYGSDIVLAMLREWATPRTLEWAATISYPYGAFIKQLPKLAERASEDAAEAEAAAAMLAEVGAEEAELATIPAATPAQVAESETNIAQLAADEAARRAARRQKFSSAAPTTPNEADPTEYLEGK